MTTESPWDTARWREAQYHYYDMQAPQLPAPTALNPASHPGFDNFDSYSQCWNDGTSRAEATFQQSQHTLPSLTDPYTDASNFRNRLHERHSPMPSGQSGHIATSPGQNFTGSWRSLPSDRAPDKHITDAPLSLHIPKSHDMPRVNPAHAAQSLENQSYSSSSSRSQYTTSLPSFASFQEHAKRADEPEDTEIAPMSSRLSCYLCTKLKPMVREVAIAVAELDENVQTFSNKSSARAIDFPKDSPVRAVQWILDRLHKAKNDLVEVSRQTSRNYYQQAPGGPLPGMGSRNVSPPNALKRHADRWEQDDLPEPKRTRSGASPDEMTRASASVSHDDRRGSMTFVSRDAMQRPGYSPPPTESVPGSAYPRTGSPTLPGRPLRALPSPSSLAYPPSGAPSLAPPTVQSIGSPSTSYQPAVSIHTASTNSATSAHIADLQHQVTLKSLALQTLQSEYASLLQKLQRERVKSQTIEKKTSVADQEVNELTSKNEELTEQVKILEGQLEDSEKKREIERADAAKEKEQWGRMLEMGGRLHARNAEQVQKLQDEKDSLSQQITAFEEASTTDLERVSNDNPARTGAAPRRASGESDRRISEDSASNTLAFASAGSSGDSSEDVASLKREVAFLKTRIEILRSSLSDMKRHNQGVCERAQEVVQRHGELGNAIDKALSDEEATAKAKVRESKRATRPRSGGSTPARKNPIWSPKLIPTVSASSLRASTKSSPTKESQSVPESARSSTSSSTLASIARTTSPNAAELGIHIPPSTSSPEELIRALGPVPAPASAVDFSTLAFGQIPDFSTQSTNDAFDTPQHLPALEPSERVLPPPRRLMPGSGNTDAYASGQSWSSSQHLHSIAGRPTTHTDTSSQTRRSSQSSTRDDQSSNSPGSATVRSPGASGSADTATPSATQSERLSIATIVADPRSGYETPHQQRAADHQNRLHESHDRLGNTSTSAYMPPPRRPGA